MAKRSLRFARVWSPAACTGPTLKQFFLGAYHSQLMRKVDRGPYLAALLTQHGVHTVHLLTHALLKRGGGIGEGFTEERDLGEAASAKEVVDAVLTELDELEDAPVFIYSHILDAHYPYNKGELKQGAPKDRYVSEVSLVDTSIGELRRELERRKLVDRTYLIVTADHGEAFKEHGRYYHARTMYEEMIRIPLLIEGPGVKARRVKRSASLIDVSPTLLSLFGASTPAHYMGESLVPFMHGETPRFARPLVTDGHDKKQAMLFDDRMKVIIDNRTGTEELYDLKRDPGEKKNLAQRADAATYFEPMRAFFDGLEKPAR
jgi:arylsulfatase A-like enzyme